MHLITELINYQIPPAIIMMCCVAIICLIPEKIRLQATIFAPIVTLFYVWQIPIDNNANISAYVKISIFDDLLPLYVHQFSHIFATIFCIAAFVGILYSITFKNSAEIIIALLYCSGALGVLFAGDLITLFFFWEFMAIFSTILIIFGKSDNAIKAGIRYAIMHFFGGVILLIGIIIHMQFNESSLITNLTINYKIFEKFDLALLAPWLILIGILINCATPPFSSWLPDSYPESSISGMLFLSAFTTKTAIFALIILFASNEILIYAGILMIFYGIIYALLENNLRRLLAYSIITHLGFMVVAVGIGSQLALYGAATQAFAHILYKTLALMVAGSVIHATGKTKLTELGGLYKYMPITMICAVIAGLTISATPLTAGFISKSLITASVHIPRYETIWYILVAASAGVLLHAGLLFPWLTFFNRKSNLLEKPKDPTILMKAAMILMCILCIAPGFYPNLIYFMLPQEVGYNPYSKGHAIVQLQILLFSSLAFFLLLPMLKRKEKISLDFDWFGRALLKYMLNITYHFTFFIKELICSNIYKLIQIIIKKYYQSSNIIPSGSLYKHSRVNNS
ncbi:MAG: proton-conducting transporter membrane subunit, partial [Pseudomonadota bacterium]